MHETALLIGGVVGVVLGLPMIAWVGIDAARRERNWLAWAGLTAFVGIFGLIAWLFARRSYPSHSVGFRHALAIAMVAPLLFGITVAVHASVTTFVIQVARVEGGAMAPALMDQDRLIVNKMAYQGRDPRVGEIVMLRYPLNPDKTFVKRVIGEPGDMVRIVDGRVFRNDVPLDEPYVLPEHRSSEDWGPEVVPDGYYFVMGDRRNGSSDSRHWLYVPKKYILGRIAYRWWPISNARGFP